MEKSILFEKISSNEQVKDFIEKIGFDIYFDKFNFMLIDKNYQDEKLNLVIADKNGFGLFENTNKLLAITLYDFVSNISFVDKSENYGIDLSIYNTSFSKKSCYCKIEFKRLIDDKTLTIKINNDSSIVYYDDLECYFYNLGNNEIKEILEDIINNDKSGYVKLFIDFALYKKPYIKNRLLKKKVI